MDIATYKGYKISFREFDGMFSIDSIRETYDTYKKATNKIDRIVKGEINKNFPIDAIDRHSMVKGKITSFNAETRDAWFTIEHSGNRSKLSLHDYAGTPRFVKITESNLKILDEYNNKAKQSNDLQKEMQDLRRELTEFIEFDDNNER